MKAYNKSIVALNDSVDRKKNHRDVELGIDILMTEIGLKKSEAKEEKEFVHLILSSFKTAKNYTKINEHDPGRRFSRYRIKKYTIEKGRLRGDINCIVRFLI
jgi:hypothetical protein